MWQTVKVQNIVTRRKIFVNLLTQPSFLFLFNSQVIVFSFCALPFDKTATLFFDVQE